MRNGIGTWIAPEYATRLSFSSFLESLVFIKALIRDTMVGYCELSHVCGMMHNNVVIRANNDDYYLTPSYIYN